MIKLHFMSVFSMALIKYAAFQLFRLKDCVKLVFGLRFELMQILFAKSWTVLIIYMVIKVILS